MQQTGTGGTTLISRSVRCAVIGAGWAGLAAAVRAVEQGWQVSLYDMAPTAGGRARSVDQRGLKRDNGQHIMIGAYTRTLDLMRTVGVDERSALQRMPLVLIDGAGLGLRLPPGPPTLSFARAVWGHPQWSWRDKLSLLTHAVRWRASGFRCSPDKTVDEWCTTLPRAIREELIDPLCVAALNTPSQDASAAVLLRVLRDALFSGPGSADLLLPRQLLSDLLPNPSLRWLESKGAKIKLGRRAEHLAADGGQWTVDGESVDQLVLACSAKEAARLTAGLAPAWSVQAAAFEYEPIITAWLSAPLVVSPAAMVLLKGEPAQFGFDLGRLNSTRSGQMTLVISGAARWVAGDAQKLRSELEAQLHAQWQSVLPSGWRIDHISTEKRATFRCTPGLTRPPGFIAPGLHAAGDYIAGPYPATLEGAVRSGEAAIEALALACTQNTAQRK